MESFGSVLFDVPIYVELCSFRGQGHVHFTSFGKEAAFVPLSESDLNPFRLNYLRSPDAPCAAMCLSKHQGIGRELKVPLWIALRHFLGLNLIIRKCWLQFPGERSSFHAPCSVLGAVTADSVGCLTSVPSSAD